MLKIYCYLPLILFPLFAGLMACESSQKEKRPLAPEVPAPVFDQVYPIPDSKTIEIISARFIPELDRVILVCGNRNSPDTATIFTIDPRNGIVDESQCPLGNNNTVTAMTWTEGRIFLACEKGIKFAVTTRKGVNEWQNAEVPAGFNSVAITQDGVVGELSAEEPSSHYVFAIPGDEFFWEDFYLNAPVFLAKRNSQGRWAIGRYREQLIFNGDTVFPTPGRQGMTYLAFNGNYQGNDWARQVGGQVPGRDKDWGASHPLDLQMDPAGYGWILWQGDLYDRQVNATVLGVNFYDPSGLLMKNLIFQAPGRDRVERSLQLLPNSKLGIHSTYTSDDLEKQNSSAVEKPKGGYAPVQSLLVFDRQGMVCVDTSFVLEKGRKVLHATVANGELVLTGIKRTQADKETSASESFLFHRRYRIKGL